MTKTMRCKACGEMVEVKEQQRSVQCLNCAEKELAEKELDEELRENPDKSVELLRAALADPGFRKGYLHRRALEKNQRTRK